MVFEIGASTKIGNSDQFVTGDLHGPPVLSGMLNSGLNLMTRRSAIYNATAGRAGGGAKKDYTGMAANLRAQAAVTSSPSNHEVDSSSDSSKEPNDPFKDTRSGAFHFAREFESAPAMESEARTPIIAPVVVRR